ncbi:MAG: methyltransferase [bacterium]|nr:methyltransferase [bacterium]
MTQELIITIEKLLSDGRGIGRAGTMAYFVKGGVPLDVLKVLETKRKKNHAEAEIVSVLTSSPMRAEPKCRYYGECGGCSLQHIDFKHHKEIKRIVLRELLYKNAKIDYKDEILCEALSPFSYRNKVTLSVRDGLVGLLREKSDSLIGIEECLLCSQSINDVLKDIREKIVFDSRTDRIVIKSSNFNRTLVAFYTDCDREDQLPPFMRTVCADNIVAVLKNKTPLYLKSKASLTDTIDGRVFSYSYSTFMQVNPNIGAKICDFLRSRIKKENRLLDLYSGVGIYSILFSDFFKEIVAVESNKASVYHMRKNISENKIKNVNSVRKFIDDKLEIEDNYFDVCIIDPPREGVHPIAMKRIFDSTAKQIIYISCDAATMSRDITLASGSGFQIKEIALFDMFPNTMHFETVVFLER